MDDEKDTGKATPNTEQAGEQIAGESSEQETPVYEKPVIRKYGQLDRVTFS